MKKLFLLLLVSFVLSLVTSNSFAEKYHGEFCWQVFDEEENPYWSYKFGIYEKEGGHFVLFGAQDYDANGNSAAHGNAIFTDDAIKMTITSTDNEEGKEVWSETFAAKLDKSTLNGTWDSLANSKKVGADVVQAAHHHGTINLIACE